MLSPPLALIRSHHLVFLALSLSCCGDPLVGSDYYGEPLLHVEGNIVLPSDIAAENINALNRLQVALFWLANLQPSTDTVAFNTDTGRVAPGAASPARYAFDLYHPPPTSVLITLPNSNQQVAIAIILLFDDLNRDGLHQNDEPFVGGTRRLMLLYTPTSLSNNLTQTPLEPGFHLLSEVPDDSDPFSGPPRCLTDPAAPFFVRLNNTNQVNLDLDFIGNPWQRVPDVNCDGSTAEWCEEVRPYIDFTAVLTPEDLIRHICTVPSPERDPIIAAYNLCQNQFQQNDPCMPNFTLCDPSIHTGPPWPEDHPIIKYYLCRHPQLNDCTTLLTLTEPNFILYDPSMAVQTACINSQNLDDFADAYRHCIDDPCFTDEIINLCRNEPPIDDLPPIEPYTAVDTYLQCVARNPDEKPLPL